MLATIFMKTDSNLVDNSNKSMTDTPAKIPY